MSMGLTKVTTKLTSITDPQRSYESLFLVDTGATDCLAPRNELEALGVQQEEKMSCELADGTVREYAYGLMRIEFMGETTAGRIIFGEPGSEPLLGAMPGWYSLYKSVMSFFSLLTLPDFSECRLRLFDLRALHQNVNAAGYGDLKTGGKSSHRPRPDSVGFQCPDDQHCLGFGRN
jgi:hypothetical protein